MAIIKKFRIKSFKNLNTIIEFKNVSLSYGNIALNDIPEVETYDGLPYQVSSYNAGFNVLHFQIPGG